MKTPPYLHITKAGQKTSPILEGSRDDDTPLPTAPMSICGLPGIYNTRAFKVPINYFVTVYQTIEATSVEDAMLKAQTIEAPDIWVDGFPAEQTTVESEVQPYEVEEVD